MSVDISGGFGLDFVSTLDNSDFQTKSLEDLRLIKLRLELTGDTSGITDYDIAVKNALATETKLRADLAAVVSEARAQTAAFTVEMQKPVSKTIFSNSADEVAAYNAQLVSGISATVDSSAAILDRAAILEKLNVELNLGYISQEKYDAAISESAIIAKDSISVTQKQIGLLEDLLIVKKELTASRLTIIDPIELERANLKLQELEQDIVRTGNMGKVGFDEFGVAIKATSVKIEESIGLIGSLQTRLNTLKAGKPDIIDPVQLSKTNAVIQDLETNIARLSNKGKAGFDEFGNKIKDFGKETDAVVEKQGKFGAAISRATNLSQIGATVVSRLSRQIIGLGVGMLSFEIGAKAIQSLITYIENLDYFTGRLDQAKQNLLALNEVMANADKAAGTQIGALKELYDAATNTNLSLKDRLAAAEQLRDSYAAEFQGATALNIINGKLKGSYDDLTTSIINVAKATAASAKIGALESTILDAEFQIAKNNAAKADELSKVKGVIGAGSVGTGGGGGTGIVTEAAQRQNIKARIDQANLKPTQNIAIANNGITFLEGFVNGVTKQSQALKEANEFLGVNLEKFDSQIAGVKRKKQLDNIKDALQIKLNQVGLEPGAADKIRADLQKVDDLEKQYTVKPTKTGKSSDPAIALLASQTKLQQEIAALKDKAVADDSTRDQKSLLAINAKLLKEYNAVVAHNKTIQAYWDSDHKETAAGRQLNTIDPNSVMAGLNTQIDNQANTNENNYIQEDINKKKKLYADYEAYKAKVGSEAANLEYADLLRSGKDFATYLDTIKKSVDATDKSGPTQARSTLVQKEIDVNNADVGKKLDQYLENTQSFQNKTKAIIDKANDEIYALTVGSATKQADLIKSGNAAGAAELQADYDKRIQITKANAVVALDQQALTQQQTIDSYSGLAASIESITLQQAAIRIKTAKDTAAAELAAGLISQSAYDQIIKIIDQANKLVKANVIASGFTAMATAFGQLSQASMGLDKNLGSTLNSMAALFTQVNALTSNIPKLENAIKNYSANQAKATGATGSSFLGTVSTIASMVPIAGAVIGAGIAIVSGVINFFKSAAATAKAAAAELVNYQNNMIDNQIKYNELLRDQQRSQIDITKLTLDQLDAQQKVLVTQKSGAQADYNTLLQQIQSQGQQVTGEHSVKYGGFLGIGKKTKVVQDLAGLGSADFDNLQKLYTEGKLTDTTKAWFEQLQTVKNEMDSIGTSAASVLDAINQAATGTTANAISQAIIDGFKAGKKTAADFATNFSDLMNSALISVFQSNVLDKQIATFYQQFSDASNSPGGLTADKIAGLKSNWNNIINGASSQIAQIQQVTGTPVTGSTSATTAVGQVVQSITQDTGTRIYGELAGIQLSSSQIRDLNMQMIQQGIQSIALLSGINVNTGRTADNTAAMVAQLVTLNKSSGDSLGVALRAAGKMGY